MKATILHDEHGGIIAVSKAIDLEAAGSKFQKVRMIPRPGQTLLEVELSEELERCRLLDLHKDYRVDVASAKLVKRS